MMRTDISKGRLVQKFNGLATKGRLFDFLHILFLLLFRWFSYRRGTSLGHWVSRFFRDRGKDRRVMGVYYEPDPHADTPTSQDRAPPAAYSTNLRMH